MGEDDGGKGGGCVCVWGEHKPLKNENHLTDVIVLLQLQREASGVSIKKENGM